MDGPLTEKTCESQHDSDALREVHELPLRERACNDSAHHKDHLQSAGRRSCVRLNANFRIADLQTMIFRCGTRTNERSES